MEKKIFSIDRFEGDIAVCISDDDDVLDVSVDSLTGLKPQDVFSARIENGALVDVIPMPDERDRRIKEYRERLHALARRSKERRQKNK